VSRTMTKSFTAALTGKTSLMGGPGMKFVGVTASLSLRSEAMHASDVGLRTIHGIMTTNHYLGTVIQPIVRNPGTWNNFASFTAYPGTITTPAGPGTWSIRGSETFRVLVIGE